MDNRRENDLTSSSEASGWNTARDVRGSDGYTPARNLNEAENTATNDPNSGSPDGNLSKAEQNAGTRQGNWQNNVSQGVSTVKAATDAASGNYLGAAKNLRKSGLIKKGPAITIGVGLTVLLVIVVALSFLMVSLLPFQIKENISSILNLAGKAMEIKSEVSHKLKFGVFESEDTSYDSNIQLANEISEECTSRTLCTVIGFSDVHIEKLKDAGFSIRERGERANGNSNVVEITTPNGTKINQDNVDKIIQTDPIARADLKKVYSGTFATFNDNSWADEISSKYNFNKTSAEKDPERTEKQIFDEATQNANSGGSGDRLARAPLGCGDEDGAVSSRTTMTGEEYQDCLNSQSAYETGNSMIEELENIARSASPLSADEMIEVITEELESTSFLEYPCAVYSISKYVNDGVKRINAEKLGNYTLEFLSRVDAAKYGDAESVDMEALGNALSGLIPVDSSESGATLDGGSVTADTTPTDNQGEFYNKVPITLVGDSLAAGSANAFRSKFNNGNVLSQGSAQITHSDYQYNLTERFKKEMIDNNQSRKNIVTMMGTNRGLTAEEIDNFVKQAGNSIIYMVNNNAPGSGQAEANNQIKQAASRHANVFEVDWKTYSDSNGRSNFYTSGDPYHIISSKQTEYINFIAETIYKTSKEIQESSSNSGSSNILAGGQKYQTKVTATEAQGYTSAVYGSEVNKDNVSRSTKAYMLGDGEWSTLTNILVNFIDASPAAQEFCVAADAGAFEWIGIAFSSFFGQAVSSLFKGIFNSTMISPTIAMFSKYITGQVVNETTLGEDMGTALMAGAGALMSRNAQSRGASLLSHDEYIAVYQENQVMIAKEAEEHRATKNPFDPTSQHTFVGSIITQLMPYNSQIKTVAGVLPSLLNIASSSIKSLFPSVNAASTEAGIRSNLNVCRDREVVQYNVATDIFCNPLMSVSSSTSRMSIQEVIAVLVEAGEYDDRYGVDVSDLRYAGTDSDETIASDSTIKLANQQTDNQAAGRNSDSDNNRPINDTPSRSEDTSLQTGPTDRLSPSAENPTDENEQVTLSELERRRLNTLRSNYNNPRIGASASSSTGSSSESSANVETNVIPTDVNNPLSGIIRGSNFETYVRNCVTPKYIISDYFKDCIVTEDNPLVNYYSSFMVFLSTVSGYDHDEFPDTAGGSGQYNVSPEASRQTADGFSLFLQGDPRWANEVFYPGHTMAAAACGPTSLAMILVALGIDAHPLTVAKDAAAAGAVVSAGATHDQPHKLANKYGFKAETINHKSISEINEQLRQGKYIWLGGAGSRPFVSYGHLVVIRKVLPNGKWLIADPASPNAAYDMTEWSPADIIAQTNVAVAISR